MFLLVRLIFGLLSLALMAVPAGLVALALTLPEAQPLVTEAADPAPASVGRARALLGRHDPRRQRPGTQGRVRLGQAEVDLALAALPQAAPALRARVRLAEATAQATLALPANPLGAYLNIRTGISNEGAGLAPRQLHLGSLAVPDALAGWLASLAWERLLAHPAWGPLARSLESARLESGALTLNYRVPDKLPEQLRGLALDPTETATLKTYHGALVQALGTARESLPLPELLRPLFSLAEERGGGAEEYRAALLVAGIPLAGKSLRALVPEARAWPPLPRRSVTLAGRHDSAQHFAASAVLAAYAGTPIARAVGLWKELEDSRGGSGFSFADLAADQAGSRLGHELAAGRPAVARRLAAGVSESELLPRLADLPEDLDARAFRARYGTPGDPRYAALAAEIEARVAALPLYR
jgi:uncharacterized protein YfiM (DUF2279 family)